MQDLQTEKWLSVSLKRVCLHKLELFYSSLHKPDIKREIMLMKNGMNLSDNIDDNIIYFLLKLQRYKEPEKKKKVINIPKYNQIEHKLEPGELCRTFNPKEPPNTFKTWEVTKRPDQIEIIKEIKSVRYILENELDLEFCLVKGEFCTIGRTGMALNESISKFNTPTLLKFLSQLKPNKNTGMSYLVKIYDILLKLDPQPLNELKSLLLIIVQDACVPLFCFIDNWLIGGILDPFQEFFIKFIDGMFVFDYSFEFPAFLDLNLAEKIFCSGNWNRLFNDVNDDSMYEERSDSDLTCTDVAIETKWVIDPQESIEYQTNLMDQQQRSLAQLDEFQKLKKPTEEQKLSEKLKDFIDKEQHVNELKEMEKRRIAGEKKDAKMKLKEEIDEFIESQNNYKKQKQEEEKESDILKVDSNYERMVEEEKIKLEKEYLDKMEKIDEQIAIVDIELNDGLKNIGERADLKSAWVEKRKELKTKRNKVIKSEWKSDSNTVCGLQSVEDVVPGSVVDGFQKFDESLVMDKDTQGFDVSQRFDVDQDGSVCDFEVSMILDQSIEDKIVTDNSPEVDIKVTIEAIVEVEDSESITTLDLEIDGKIQKESKYVLADPKDDFEMISSKELSNDWYYNNTKPTLLEKYEYETQTIKERRTKTLELLFKYSQDYIPITSTTSTFLLSIQSQIKLKNKVTMTKISNLNVIHSFELIYKYFLFGSGTFLRSFLDQKLSDLKIESPITLDYIGDTIHLDFKTEKPLDLIITKRSLKKLKSCFALLTTVFKTRKALNGIYGKGLDIKKDLMYMCGFVRGVVLYLQVTIEKEWINFRDAVKDESILSVDDLVEAYHGFVDVVYKKLLLDHENLMALIVDYLVVLQKIALEVRGELQKESRGYLVSTGRVLYKNLVRSVEEINHQGADLEDFLFFIKQ